MWDTAENSQAASEPLSHDLPCQYCGHASHCYLPCDQQCGCEPAVVLVGTGR